MLTLLVAIGSFFGFIVAYHTYGRWLGKKIFELDPKAVVPAEELRDDVDYAPTPRQVIFGHHFTSIAGTGPIVGPAIAVFWGWLPALLWVLLGSIFIGAVHDFGSLVISLRNRGQTVGEIAGRLISKRARLLFLLILFFALTVVLAVFGLVIAYVFSWYPESLVSVWISMPLAVAIGYWGYKKKRDLTLPSIIALAIVYVGIAVGTYYFHPTLPSFYIGSFEMNPVLSWTAILMVYCFVASVLPVWVLLQPRDYINSHQLVVALVLLVSGLLLAAGTGKADLAKSAPAYVPFAEAAATMPPIFPFLFITIACGACSGFHCLVSSGTTSKQIANETDAQYVAYGSMLLEGGLAVLVILCCCAGLGMGLFSKDASGVLVPVVSEVDNSPLVAEAAWRARYFPAEGSFAPLKDGVAAFVDGGANFLTMLGIPLAMGIAIVATLVACFAATTLDTATRLQRYVIQELGSTLNVKPLTNKYAATGVAVGLAFAIACIPGPKGPGSGGLILWPLFGAINQLLAGLAFMVIAFHLWRRNKPIFFVVLPMLFMLLMPALALSWQMFEPSKGWLWKGDYLLFSIGAVIMGLQVWMVIEGLLLWPKAKGVMEQALPPLPVVTEPSASPNC
ncbi:MAG: carbon starvation protein A [Planctomycetaceae bacterium]|nr:carbon starvation protein A [Planctomycetaceae bacterium]MCB9952361.1 carbon starvation protein A [Planctomycetaceae bacterium]